MRPFVHFFLIFTVFCSSAVQSAAMPDIETYGELPSVSDVSISPNGDLVAYRLTKSDKEDFVVVRSLSQGKVIVATDVSKIDPKSNFFPNNDYLVLRGSTLLDHPSYRNSFNAGTLFSLNLKTKKVEKLIRLGEQIGKQWIKLGQSGVGRVAGRSKDGETLYIPAYIEVDRTDLIPKRSLLSVKTTGEGRPKIAAVGTRDTRDFFMDDNENVLARENLNNRTNVHSIDIRKKNGWETIYKHKSDIPTHNFIGLNEDFTGIVFSRDDDDLDYLLLSLADGSVTEMSELNIERDATLRMNKHRVARGVKYAGFLPSYKYLDEKYNQRVKRIVNQFPDQAVHIVSGGKHIVVRVEGSLYVGDYFIFTEGEKPKKIASARLKINHEQINPIVIEEYKARDGLVIPTLLTFPRDRVQNPENLPTVIMPHGGPASYNRLGFNYRAQALASRGFLVIQPQFRGSTGFGKSHYEAGLGQWGKGMQDDLSDAVKMLAKKGVIDPQRVCIVGASYGGYAALAGAAFTPDTYRCAVSIAGVSHLPEVLTATKKRFGTKHWVNDYWNRSMLAGDYDKQALKALSPYYSAEKIKVPVLLLHGEDDTVVEYKQSMLMYKAIKKHKGEVRLVKLKNDDHYLQSGSTRIQAVKEMVEFVETHIGI